MNAPAYVIFNDRTLIEMAETRPRTLDEMARIGGVGAKKLESYGVMFLEVINGAMDDIHPRRRKLAGRDAGTLYDRLMAVQAALMRGEDGTGKPMTLSASALAKVAEVRPRDLPALERLIGERHTERFGAALLEVLRED
jgi:ATP-dependent DNA helicase RecQ